MIDHTMKERFLADQSARELAPLLTANQRALVSLMATAELHDIDLKHMVTGFADETGSQTAKEFAEQLPPKGMKTEVHVLDVANGIDKLMPQPCKVALNSARASGELRSFYRSWLTQTVDDRIHWVRHENTNFATIGRLFIRTFFCITILSFILLYIVPEFQKMAEEFGIELSGTMQLFMLLSDWIAKFSPLLFLFIACICLYIICFRPSVFANYFRRWMPGKWRQVNLPKPIMDRKLMAWDLLAFRGMESADGESEATLQTDWDALVASKKLGSGEAEIMKSSQQLETQAWLLRNMANKKHDNRKSRFAFFVSSVSFLFQVLLAGIIILATFSIFSFMLDMMRGLQ